MRAPRLGMSQLARDAGFGTRVWSETGYWGGRFYHLIVAIGTATILIASTWQRLSVPLLAILLAGYGLYLLIRFTLIRGHESTYYRPWIQFVRAQVSIAVLTILIARLEQKGAREYLWLLYTLQLMIIGRHLSTPLFILSILQVWGLLAFLRLGIAPPSPASASQIHRDLVAQGAWIALIGFVLHYLLRNIDARDGTIAMMSRINDLAHRSMTGREWKSHWEAALKTYLNSVGGRRGLVWLCNPRTGEIRPFSGLGRPSRAVSPTDSDEFIPVDTDHPIAEVARTGQPLLWRAQPRLGDRLSRARQAVRIHPLPPDVYARILVPIGPQAHGDGLWLGVLGVDFDRDDPPRERLLEHYFDFFRNLADWVVPVLRFVQQIREQQTLRHIGVQVSSSLRLETVLNETLDALTGPLGFDLATIALVDEEAQLIRCRGGRNVPPAWVEQMCYPLDSPTILADVVRRGEIEVIQGWDDRLDRRLYKRFHQDRLIRAFVPIQRQPQDNGSPPRPHGVVEVGYRLRHQNRIPPDQLALLTTFMDQVAVAIEKARLFRDIRQHRKMLVQLHRVSHDIADARHPDRVLTKLGEGLQQALEADIVMIYRFNRATQEIEPPLTFGQVWGRLPLRRSPLDRGIIAEILHKGRPYYAPDATADPLLCQPNPPRTQGERPGGRRTFTVRQNIKSFAGVPMLVNDEVVGVLCVNYRRRHAFSENERCVLELAAQLAAVALRNAELNALAAELAAEEERKRLTSQLHDSVSQLVSAIPLMVSTALEHLPSQPDKTAYWLERIRHTARQIAVEVRANIFEMGTAPSHGRSLQQALEEVAGLARGCFQLEVEITSQISPERLSASLETELLLICREAIVNAGRHAQARRVTVELLERGDRVYLRVQDDGEGFDPSALSPWEQRGLKFMRQRIERMGGRFSVHSRPGEGTTIEATVPA